LKNPGFFSTSYVEGRLSTINISTNCNLVQLRDISCNNQSIFYANQAMSELGFGPGNFLSLPCKTPGILYFSYMYSCMKPGEQYQQLLANYTENKNHNCFLSTFLL